MDSERTALLIMDVQPEIVERFGGSGLAERLARAAAAARTAGVRVIYVKIGFRDGYPEISPRSAMFSRIAPTTKSIACCARRCSRARRKS